MKIPFKPTDILLPKKNFEKWSVIACDQFTSDTTYWEETENIVGENLSTLKITLPEIYLEEKDIETRINNINKTMFDYLDSSIFDEYKNALIYIERIQPDGRIRPGIIGAIDLEEYDYRPNSKKFIRATEGTVLERIPPRVRIRKDAPLETPHTMLLIDDVNKTVVEPLAKLKENMTKLYDFELMMGGGRIKGYLIDNRNQEFILEALKRLCDSQEEPFLFAVGDGNHSLATAKECYEQEKKNNPQHLELPSRYALVEIGNIHCDALDFEPIYRVLFNIDPDDVLKEFNQYFKTETPTSDIIYTHGHKEGKISIEIPGGKISVGVIQEFIDKYTKKHPEAKIDYIHGVEDVKKLSSCNNSIGFIYDGISKDTLFESVKKTGSLPKKTFSMGEAKDKRYYLECRKIK